MSWGKAKLKEHCSLVTKGTTPTSLGYEFSEDGIGFVRVQNLQDGRVAFQNCDLFIDEKVDAALSRSRIFPGDILLSIAGTIGRVGIVPANAPPLNCNQAVAIIRIKDSLGREYLKHWLATPQASRQMSGRAVTATISNLSLSQIKELEIPLPPLEEQRRIAEILDLADGIRAKRQEALAEVEGLTQAVFLEMFGDLRKASGQFKQVLVKDAGIVQLGRQRTPKYQTGLHTHKYVRVANVYKNRLDLSDVLAMDFNEADFRRYHLKYGDILLNEGQSLELVGRPAMWRNEIVNCCFQNTLVRFQACRKIVDSTFALHVFLSYFRFGFFSQIASKTSNVAHLGGTRFGNMSFPLPPLPLQQKFAERVEAIEGLKASHQRSLEEMDALFASLQSRAFRGEL